jgi:hypothetical protein
VNSASGDIVLSANRKDYEHFTCRIVFLMRGLGVRVWSPEAEKISELENWLIGEWMLGDFQTNIGITSLKVEKFFRNVRYFVDFHGQIR